MKLAPNDIELIEKSLDGMLSLDEKSLFDEKYQNSDTFREAVLLQQAMLSSLEAKHKSDLKAELSQMLHDVNAEKTDPDSKRWYMIAASIVVLLGAVWIFNQSYSYEQKLYNKYFEPFPVQGFVRGSIEEAADEIFQSYVDEDYERTVKKILELESSQDSINAQFIYLGNAYLHLSQPDNAIESFLKVESSDRYYSHAQWYLALAYLQKGNQEKAIEILEKLSNQNTIYSSSSKSLLEELD
ncbi:tetratricopeptide repeat protein [Ekhidna sp.]